MNVEKTFSRGALISAICILIIGSYLMHGFSDSWFVYIVINLIIFSPPLIGVLISINKPVLGNKWALIFSVIHLVIGVPLMGIYLLLILGMGKGTWGDMTLAGTIIIGYFISVLSLIIISSIKISKNKLK